MSAQQMARVVKKRGSFDVETSAGQLISGGYSRKEDAISTAHRLGYDVEGEPSDAARKAYDRIYTGFNPAGFAGFKRGYDAAVEDQATTHAQMRRALEEAKGWIKEEGRLPGQLTPHELIQTIDSALALPPMEGRE